MLLENLGSNEPLDKRPITLLSVLYRTWAMHRAKQFRSWQKAIGIKPFVGDLPGCCDQALLLGLHLEMAQLEHRVAGGIALDQSKFYDNVSLSLLQQAADLAKLPRWSPPYAYRCILHLDMCGS